MKIVFSTDQTYLHGGIEKVMAEKANYFADVFGYDVTILTTEQKNNPPQYPISGKVKHMDIGVNYNRSKSYFSFENLKKLPLHFNKLKRALKQIDPDIIIICNYAFDFYYYPFIHPRSKKIKEFHGSQYIRNNKLTSIPSKLKNWIQLQIEKKYDVLLVLNPDEQKFFHSNNTAVIPNPIHISNLKAALDKKQVLAAGRISPVKGFERLIDVWAIVAKTYPDWELHIYGEEYLNTREILDLQIQKHGISKNIKFKGVTTDMRKTMLDYSLYLMTSHTECFPMVLLESLSVGLPIISFDVPTGPRNIITHGKDGILIQNNDISAFAETIKDLIQQASKLKEMGNKGKDSSYRFDNKVVMQQWKELFIRLLS